MKRTNYNGMLGLDQVGESVSLVGWVNKKRNFGARNFVDLRDRSGLVQLVFDERFSEDLKPIRPEYLLAVKGRVAPRKDPNPAMPTGAIEILVDDFEVINGSHVTPLLIQDETDALEDTRLKYRYLDLRRPVMQQRIILRHEIIKTLRNFLNDHGFLEIETPMLGKSTPEGARDYLVPSRNFPGSFYALPQSPQLYKQLLMISGFERYYQVVRCFRDEDLRADRQPEFTQLDLEMSFMSQPEIMELQEKMMKDLFKKVLDVDVPVPFLQIPYDQALSEYGSDKPDLRFGLKLQNLSETFQNSTFAPFAKAIEQQGVIMALPVFGQIYSNKQIKQFEEVLKKNGAPAAITLKYDGSWKGSAVKNLEASALEKLAEQGNATWFFVCGDWAKSCLALGALRNTLADELGLKNPDEFAFCWVVDFPMFEFSETENRYVSQHHPFTQPLPEDVPLLSENPAKVRTSAYDIVCNGYELGGGSLRIYNPELQTKIFEVLGFDDDQIRNQFGFFIDAFQYGTPPHGGLAYGLDRLVMIMAKTDSIRDVIAFPKSASARDLMSEAPSLVSEDQLEVLSLQIEKDNK